MGEEGDNSRLGADIEEVEAFDPHMCRLEFLLVSQDGHTENDLVARAYAEGVDVRDLSLVQECSVHRPGVSDTDSLADSMSVR